MTFDGHCQADWFGILVQLFICSFIHSINVMLCVQGTVLSIWDTEINRSVPALYGGRQAWGNYNVQRSLDRERDVAWRGPDSRIWRMRGATFQLCHFTSSVTIGKSRNLSPSVPICKDEKASWPPSIEFSIMLSTFCESDSRQPPEETGLWHIEARRWLSGRLAPEAAPLTFLFTDEDAAIREGSESPKIPPLTGSC